MSHRWPQLGLPLLTKELIEQAARKRTYVVRLVYASLLFLLAFWQFTSILSSNGSNSLAILGSGTDMFNRVIELQSLGILLFLPALACGAITSEKERDSLTMLLVTRLGPFTILLEKLLGRLVPMFSFLLLSLPLLLASPSSQSSPLSVLPLGASQASVVLDTSPNPSPSTSPYQVAASTASSSMLPLQSLSMSSQDSGAPG